MTLCQGLLGNLENSHVCLNWGRTVINGLTGCVNECNGGWDCAYSNQGNSA